MLKSLFVPLLLLCACGLAQDTPMFRGNPQHTGVYSAPGAPQFHQVKWKFKTNGFVFSSPAAVSGVLYFGSTDHNLYAIDLETGKQKWKFETGSRVTGSPAVESGVVYFGSFDGNFYAVDAATGQQRWKFQTGGERRFAGKHLHGMQPAGEAHPDAWDFYLSSPVVNAGVVYFGSGDNNVYALNTSDGSVKWKFTTGNVVHASPTLAHGVLYVGSWDSYFYALDAANGKVKWRFKTGEDPANNNQVGIQSSAAVVDGVVYFGCRDSQFYALDAKTGAKKWSYDNKGTWIIASPVVRDGKVYFSSSEPGYVFAFDAATGKQLYRVDDKRWIMFSSPAIAGNTMYVGSFDGTLRAIDVDSGNIAWRFQTDAGKQNVPGLSNPDGATNYNLLFFGDFSDDMVFAVQTVLMKTGAILTSPVVVKDTVYFGSSDGNLYAVN